MKKASIEKKLVAKTTTIKKGIPVDDSVVYFGSGTKFPFHKLSNFNECTIVGKIWIFKGFNEYVLKEFVFPSAEHYWFSHFFVLEEDVKRLAIGGDLSTLEGLKHFYKGKELEKKMEYWSKKDNVGIVPKLLAGKEGTKYRKRAVKLGMRMSIHPCPMYGEVGKDKTLSKIWSRILLAKFCQNEQHRQILLNTGDKTLVEFTRAPVTRLSREFWTGRVVDGKLCGKNYMGECMMSARDVISSFSK